MKTFYGLIIFDFLKRERVFLEKSTSYRIFDNEEFVMRVDAFLLNTLLVFYKYIL